MQSLQRQVDGTHILIGYLKLIIEFFWLNSSGMTSHIFLPKICEFPWIHIIYLRGYKISTTSKTVLFAWQFKISQLISGHNLWFILSIWSTNTWIFLWCKEIDLSFSKIIYTGNCNVIFLNVPAKYSLITYKLIIVWS